MTFNELKLKYADRAVNRAGCWLLDATASLEFLEDLRVSQVPLNGIEGYWLRGAAIEPSLANSVYFMGTDIRVKALAGDDVISKAKGFITDRINSGLLFDFDAG